VQFEVDTPSGPALVALDQPRRTAALLILGHGAGGGVDAPDLRAVRDAALGEQIAVARVTQPYRVAGRRSPAPAVRLDEAWLAAVAAVRRRRGLARLAVVVGGRSSGARVACRTAATTGAVAVVALGFPLSPPGRPLVSRLEELEQPRVPVLVVQGERDAFGVPPPAPGRRIVVVAGADHSLRKNTGAVADAVVRFVTSTVASARV
jgi:predicted alpha/beta-hydrolase family hydrolase